MKILAFTGAGISKQSNIPTFMERPDVREKLFRSYANTHHEEYNEVIKQLKANMNGAKPNDAHIALAEYHIPLLYGDPAPNYQKAYEMVYTLQPGDIFLVVGCSFHTGISVDLREVAKARGARIIEIQEDAAHNVRKVLEELLNNN